MSDLRFGVLGPLEVLRGGEPAPISPGRRRGVLACLLVHAGHPVAADVLIEAGWRDDLPENPSAALHTVVSRLRAVLGTEAVSAGPAGYTLLIHDGALDADRFAALCDAARTAPAREASRLLAQALSLWRGPAYAEFADRDFATSESARLERLRLDATEEHAAALIGDGDRATVEQAADELEALLAEHPFREHAVELLLTALYAAHRQADALARLRTYRALLADELGLDPGPALRTLESQILGHSVPAAGPGEAPPAAPAWIDTSTAFVGRDRALADLVAAVSRDRVVTVSGIGGVGKTRLAAQAVPLLVARLHAPASVVELAGIPADDVGAGGVGAALADALGIGPQGDDLLGRVVDYLSVGGTLLVLDNCEHVRAQVAQIADTLVRRCPGVRILATSRHRLGIPTERVVPLTPFVVPGPSSTTAELATTPAVRLFVDRVRRLRPSYELGQDDVTTVAEICRRLDGLPLALELAASRVAPLGAGPVLDRLGREPAEGPFRDLRAVVEWSVRLLAPEQARLLTHLAVFTSELDQAAVAGLVAHLGPPHDAADVTGALAELVESHLITRQDDTRQDDIRQDHDGVVTYRLPAMVRSYAAQQLATSGDEQAVRLAHARWAGDVAQRAARDWVSGHAVRAGRHLARSEPDLAAAVRWALANGRLDVAASITSPVKQCLHWMPGVELGDLILEVAERCAGVAGPGLAAGVAAGAMWHAERGHVDPACRLAAAALAASDDDAARMLAGLAMGVAHFYSGDHARSATWLRGVSAIAGLPAGHRVEPDITLALLAFYHDDLPAAQELASAAALCADACGAQAAHAFARYAAGEVTARSDPGRGAALFRAAADQADRVGAAHVAQVSRLALLAVLVRGGRLAEAGAIVGPLLHDVRRVGSWPQVWTTLRIAAELLTARGRPEDAAFLLAAADAAPGAPAPIGPDVERYDLLWDELRRHLGAPVVARLAEFAAGIPRTRVVDRATSVLEPLAG